MASTFSGNRLEHGISTCGKLNIVHSTSTTTMVPNIPRFDYHHVAESSLLIDGVMHISEDKFDWKLPNEETILLRGMSNCSVSELDLAIRSAKLAHDVSWPLVPYLTKISLLNRLADSLTLHSQELCYLSDINSGNASHTKTPDENDIQRAIRTLRLYMNLGIPSKTFEEQRPESKGLVFRYQNSVGVIGLILSRHCDLSGLIEFMIPCIMSGNSIVIRVSEVSPLIHLKFGKLISQIEFPRGLINIVTGNDPSLSPSLASHSLVDRVLFQGTPRIASFICASLTKPVHYEFVETSSALVISDANPVEAAIQLCESAFSFPKSWRITVHRIHVHESILDAFLAKVVEISRTASQTLHLPSGRPLRNDHGGYHQCMACVEKLLDEGVALLHGGVRITAAQGSVVSPTVFRTDDMFSLASQVVLEGPIMCVAGYSDLSSVLSEMNSINKFVPSRNLIVFGKELTMVTNVARKLDGSSILVNSVNSGEKLDYLRKSLYLWSTPSLNIL